MISLGFVHRRRVATPNILLTRSRWGSCWCMQSAVLGGGWHRTGLEQGGFSLAMAKFSVGILGFRSANVVICQPPPSLPAKRRLEEEFREALRVRGYSFDTERSYWMWTRQYIFFHGKRHPREMGVAEVQAFLNHLAVIRGKVFSGFLDCERHEKREKQSVLGRRRLKPCGSVCSRSGNRFLRF